MGSWLLAGELKSFEKPCAIYDFFRACNIYANFLLTRALITHTNYVVVVGSRGWDRQFQTKGSGVILHNINVFMLKLYGSLWSSPRVLVCVHSGLLFLFPSLCSLPWLGSAFTSFGLQRLCVALVLNAFCAPTLPASASDCLRHRYRLQVG